MSESAPVTHEVQTGEVHPFVVVAFLAEMGYVINKFSMKTPLLPNNRRKTGGFRTVK
jgi:hypothetical protein